MVALASESMWDFKSHLNDVREREKDRKRGTSLAVQGLAVQCSRLWVSTAGGAGWILGLVAKILHAKLHDQKKKSKNRGRILLLTEIK